MRRSLGIRLFAWVFAPWFTMVAIDPPALHVCPMHSGHAAAFAHQSAGSASHGSIAHEAASAAEHSQNPSAPQHHSNQCTCLGCSCCATSGVVVPATPVSTVAVRIVRQADALPPFTATRVARVDHALPFATAPPLPATPLLSIALI